VQDAIQKAQNAPQKTETTSKGKTTKATAKMQDKANDTVKTQIINKAIAEVQRLKLSDEEVSEIIYKHYKMKISSWSDLQEKQIIEMTENLESWSKEK
jgi:FKBP-type peptidyl-prolyl cis-trans isomerase (trigger factor)